MNNRRHFIFTLFSLGLLYLLLRDFVEWITLETGENTNGEETFGYVSTFTRDLAEKYDTKDKNEEAQWKNVFMALQKQSQLKELQEACLPRFICELFSVEDQRTLTESERSLMSLIADSSLPTRPSSISQYQFAAHMGRLVLGVDNNNCQNFYPACPLGANEALALSRRLKMR